MHVNYLLDKPHNHTSESTKYAVLYMLISHFDRYLRGTWWKSTYGFWFANLWWKIYNIFWEGHTLMLHFLQICHTYHIKNSSVILCKIVCVELFAWVFDQTNLFSHFLLVMKHYNCETLLISIAQWKEAAKLCKCLLTTIYAWEKVRNDQKQKLLEN